MKYRASARRESREMQYICQKLPSTATPTHHHTSAKLPEHVPLPKPASSHCRDLDPPIPRAWHPSKCKRAPRKSQPLVMILASDWSSRRQIRLALALPLWEGRLSVTCEKRWREGNLGKCGFGGFRVRLGGLGRHDGRDGVFALSGVRSEVQAR